MDNGLDLTIILPAFAAGLLVLLTHIPLGAQVLKRGIVFIDLAIAQIAALGVIIAGVGDLDPQGWAVQGAAAVAAVLGALLLTWTEKRWPEVQEAQIGVMFILAATAGLLLVAHDPHGGEHLQDLLAGQILWVRYSQLLLPALVTGAICLALYLLHGRLGRLPFYLLFALAVTASVQLVGVYLVFTSLIVPALAVRHYAKWRLPLAYLIGAGGYAAGLVLSTMYDLPSGALIVWCLTVLAMAVYACGPKGRPASV
ncbi:metal ABC transporter permease [Pseudoduganella namucuonensis]|uniref:Zinc/manganese transport system permease protein n=1 Tax=Pseudoduganella namucuonensis TaxID=1035707 RepID=A0A1I7HAB7_9BURK|nr:metal ABC transporter permease [Pseudoduganella namucuonensis]SFU57539.1 zinc/manganese transport system permease protein [Pseudoduganella namucuonensis]